MRIIAGKHRGRKIEMADGKRIRPTSARTREAIFNILSHGQFSDGGSPLIGQRVVDLFCGSGALGLEALSRGAAHATFVDQSQDSLNLVRRSVEKMNEAAQVRFLRSDSSILPPASQPCSVAFLDPPYHTGLATKALASLHKQGWLQKGGIAVIEQSARETAQFPDGYEQFDERRYGNSVILLVRLAV